MRREGLPVLLLGATLLAQLGCGGPATVPRTPDEQAMFGAASVRVHPSFTQIKDWTGDDKPDGIEAVLEVEDQFGEPARSAGNVRFELYNFVPADPARRGKRLAMWSYSLASRDEQIAHWDTAARSYSFKLPYDKIRKDHAYVLLAQFDLKGGRMFDQLVIEPSTKEGYKGDRRTQRAPINAPAHGHVE